MCYFVSRDAVSNWYVANYNCKQLEGRLAIVNSQEIHSEISYIINDIITADSLITSRKLWIGLRRGGWTWDTGKDFSVMIEVNLPLSTTVTLSGLPTCLGTQEHMGSNSGTGMYSG